MATEGYSALTDVPRVLTGGCVLVTHTVSMEEGDQYTDQATVEFHVRKVPRALPDGEWVLTVQPHGEFNRREFVSDLTDWVHSLDDPTAGIAVQEFEFRDSFSASVLNVIVEMGTEHAIDMAFGSLVTLAGGVAARLRSRVPIEPMSEDQALRRCRDVLVRRYQVNFADLEVESIELRTENGAVGEFRGPDGTVYTAELAVVKGAVSLVRTKRSVR